MNDIAMTPVRERFESRRFSGATDPLPAVSTADSMIHRKSSCSCGGGCPACAAKSDNLLISQPNDPAEIEADSVADRIMAMPATEAAPNPRSEAKQESAMSGGPKTVRRKCVACEDDEKDSDEMPVMRREDVGAAPAPPPDDAPSSIKKVLNSGGQPLDHATRGFFEPRFGHDFSDVRIHADPAAARSARDIDAKAYAFGSNIVFAAGEYRPDAETGRRLLAHELTHVVQQRTGVVRRTIQRDENDPTSKLRQELIPNANLTIDLSGGLFSVGPEASFQAGPKTIQLIRIALNLLLQDQYTDQLAVELTVELESRKKQYQRAGHFKDTRDAFDGEKIEGFHFSVEPLMFILKFIEGKGLTVHLSDEQMANLETAFANRNLWADIVRVSGEENMPLPSWYIQPVFIQHMTARAKALEEYKEALFEYRETGDPQAKAGVHDAVVNVFYDIYGDIALLESIRKDVTLYKDPETQAAYQAIWYLTDKTREADKPAPVLRSLENAFSFLEFSKKDEHLRINAEFYPDMRRQLIVNFLKEKGFPENNLKLLPPYPAFIVSPDLNEDNTTVDTATNSFRFITDTEAVHGYNLLHGTTIAMARDIYYTWDVVSLPESLKFMRDSKMDTKELVKQSDEFVKNSPQNLSEPLKKYSPSRDDYEQSVDMDDLGIGDFLLVGRAAPHYREDMNWVQQPSSAGFPFFVFDAETLATNSAYSEWDQLTDLKNRQEKADNPEDKEQFQEQIDRMEARESSGLLELTQKDVADTEKLIDAARKLRVFIVDDREKNLSVQGNASTDPFIIRLKNFDPVLHDVYLLIREMYEPTRYDDLTAIDEYVKILEGQAKELKGLGDRVDDAQGRFKAGSPVYRVVAALVKEDDGNVVPLLMVAGYHPDADPANGNYKIKLVDVTFNAAKKGDMIYVGDSKGTEDEAVQSAFVQFGEDNKYGEGKIVFRLPQTSIQGQADSVTTFFEYLEYALAAAGIIMLVIGTVASAGTLSPLLAGGIMALGVSLAVVSAAMSVRNMQKRNEKGTLEMDTETALDIVNIIGSVVMVVGTISRVTMAARATTLARVLMVQRLERLIAVYDVTELGANIYLLSVKVKEDIDAIKKLNLPKEQEDEMISSVVFDAVQQGAMMGISAYSTLRQIPDIYQKRVETSHYRSWEEKGWIRVGEKGEIEITTTAPPFLQKNRSKVGTAPADQQGEMARKAVVVEPLRQNQTKDGEHTLTLTERGRIIRCSDLCQDLRAKYQKILEQDPDAHKRLLEIEEKAALAAKDGDKARAQEALDEATELEDSLRWTDSQWRKFTGAPESANDVNFDPGPKPPSAVTPKPGAPPAAPTNKTGRNVEIIDLMTAEEIAADGGMQQAVTRLGNVMGKSVSDVSILKTHWEAAVKKVLNGKAITDFKPDKVNNKLFPQANEEFWKLVAKDPAAVAFLETNGFSIAKKGGEPQAMLGPVGKKTAKKKATSQERRVELLPRDKADDWHKALDADNLEFTFKRPATKPETPVKKAPMVLTPEERRLETHGKSLGMLDSEVELFIERFRKLGLSVDEMAAQMDKWAETLKSNPNAKARMAPDFILDADSRAKLPDFEHKIAGTGGIEKISVRDATEEDGLAVTIEGTILPQRLARKPKDVTPTRRRAPEFNQSDKLFSNKEAGLSAEWQRLHLWGPGFGDEAAAGMMWGPRKVNLVWQNESIESYIRQLATLNEVRGGTTRVKATAVAWETPVPGGFKPPQGENFLKRVEYVVTLQRPGQPDTTIRVTLDVAPPPKADIAGFELDPPSAINLGDVL